MFFSQNINIIPIYIKKIIILLNILVPLDRIEVKCRDTIKLLRSTIILGTKASQQYNT